MIEKRGDKWCVVHAHARKPGSPTDKEPGAVIKCFDTRQEAEAMHKAIQANKKGMTWKAPCGTCVKALGGPGSGRYPKGSGGEDKETSKSIKEHPNYSKVDYEALSGKGYTDKEIKEIWDRDRAAGEGPNERKDITDNPYKIEETFRMEKAMQQHMDLQKEIDKFEAAIARAKDNYTASLYRSKIRNLRAKQDKIKAPDMNLSWRSPSGTKHLGGAR